MTLLRRLTQHPDATALPPFHAMRRVAWRLDIPSDGSPAELTPVGEDHPIPTCHRTVGVQPSLAVDHIGYVLGWADDKTTPTRVARYHTAFTSILNRYADTHGHEAPAARVAADWFTQGGPTRLAPPDKWATRDLVTVAVDGHDLTNHPTAQTFWTRLVAEYKGTGRHGLCLVCGHTGALMATLPTAIPARLLPGAATPVVLTPDVGISSPVCAECADRCVSGAVAALSGERGCMPPGQDTHHCWWYTGTEPDTDWISETCLGRAKTREDLERLRHDRDTCPPDTHAHSLMVNAGSGGRATVQHWVDMPLRDVLTNLTTWWEHAEIAHQDDTIIPTVQGMLYAAGSYSRGHGYTPPGGRDDRRHPWLYRQLATAALEGRSAPADTGNTVLRSVKNDGHVGPTRASMLRATGRAEPTRHEKTTPSCPA